MELINEEYYRICPEMKNNSYLVLKKWIYKFVKRNNFHIKNFKYKKLVFLFDLYIKIITIKKNFSINIQHLL